MPMFKSKAKGSAFERLVAGHILSAANKHRPKGKKFTKKHCFRTPLSGGHVYVGGSDLQIHRRLRKKFFWLVECKHRKTWRIDQMFATLKGFQAFIDQVTTACKNDRHDRKPLIVIRGHGGGIYAACRMVDLMRWDSDLATHCAGFIWYDLSPKPVQWKMILLAEFLTPLSDKCRKLVITELSV